MTTAKESKLLTPDDLRRLRIKKQYKQIIVPGQSQGLGDTIAKGITTVTFGILKPCSGCKKRQAKLNKIFPYKNTTEFDLTNPSYLESLSTTLSSDQEESQDNS